MRCNEAHEAGKLNVATKALSNGRQRKEKILSSEKTENMRCRTGEDTGNV